MWGIGVSGLYICEKIRYNRALLKTKQQCNNKIISFISHTLEIMHKLEIFSLCPPIQVILPHTIKVSIKSLITNLSIIIQTKYNNKKKQKTVTKMSHVIMIVHVSYLLDIVASKTSL